MVWHADHSFVYKAFDNPLLRPRIEALGMRQDTAFACLFDLLYRPTDEVVRAMRTELQPLLNPLALKARWVKVQSD